MIDLKLKSDYRRIYNFSILKISENRPIDKYIYIKPIGFYLYRFFFLNKFLFHFENEIFY